MIVQYDCFTKLYKRRVRQCIPTQQYHGSLALASIVAFLHQSTQRQWSGDGTQSVAIRHARLLDPIEGRGQRGSAHFGVRRNL